MNELQIFNNVEFGEIRTAVVNNEPMFCLIDICKALELSNSRIVADRLDEDERRKLDLPRQGETWFVTESGLYAVILRSDKPNAKKFRKWVTAEVLPSIRKTGGYNKQLSPQEMMRIQLGMIDDHEARIENLENNMTIDYGQQTVLGDEVNKVVITALGGKGSDAYKKIGKKVFAECNHDLKHYFHVNARNNIPKKRFEEAVQYIQNWRPCTNTQIMISDYNSQMKMYMGG